LISFKSFEQKLFHLKPGDFDQFALEIFRYQAMNNITYKTYLSYLNVKAENIKSVNEIPFMPISFFKTHEVKSGSWQSEAVFKSSGTTGQIRSQHHVKDLAFYNRVSQTIFESQYGNLNGYTILALLPSYLERGDSSLIYMVDYFISLAGENSGFYLDNIDELVIQLERTKENGQNVLLLGVSFALLDLAEKHSLDLNHVTVMETGGMKGRRKEMVRSELHEVLKKSFKVNAIHSEYGMTELLSQAYSKKDGFFYTPPWVRIILRDLEDPFNLGIKNRPGGINVIDLANFDTCSFIEIQDLGRVYDDGAFEVLGRIDNSEIRGCNLLISSV